jgi:ferredoxin-type protein NapH
MCLFLISNRIIRQHFLGQTRKQHHYKERATDELTVLGRKAMNKLPKIALVSVLVVSASLMLLGTMGFGEQANALDTGNSDVSPAVQSVDSAFLTLQPPLPCYGPCITANISRNQVNLGESVTISGRICPPADNITVRVTFTRPDYTWIDLTVLADNQTGEFSVTQQIDMRGFWNIFPIYGHISDRLYVNVTDPANPLAPEPTPQYPLPAYRPNWTLIAAAAVIGTVGLVAITVGTRKKTRKISSLRLFVQIMLVFLLFFGVFIDHQNLPVPAEQIAPHEFLVGVDSLSIMPDGLPLPVFGCYYPCGRTFTCPLWQIQAYIYPFWNTGHGWGVDYTVSGLERLAIVFGVVIVAAIVLGRFWCGWICPFGLYLDLMTRLRKALKIKHRNLSPSLNQKIHQLSYVILAAIIIISALFASQALIGTQLIPGTETGGFIYTYFSAPFCQVCPMKPLCILAETSVGLMRPEWVFGPTTGQFWQLGQYFTSVNLIILGVVTVAAFFFRRSWCRICPLGALIALFNRFPPFKWISGVKIEKTEAKCTKCGVCKRVCPTQVTEVYEKKGGDVTTAQCLLCLRCVELCPEKDCLQFKFAGKTVCRSRNWLEEKS